MQSFLAKNREATAIQPPSKWRMKINLNTSILAPVPYHMTAFPKLYRWITLALSAALFSSCAYDPSYSSSYSTTPHRTPSHPSSSDSAVPLIAGAAIVGGLLYAAKHSSDKKKHCHNSYRRHSHHRYTSAPCPSSRYNNNHHRSSLYNSRYHTSRSCSSYKKPYTSYGNRSTCNKSNYNRYSSHKVVYKPKTSCSFPKRIKSCSSSSHSNRNHSSSNRSHSNRSCSSRSRLTASHDYHRRHNH